MKKIKYVLAAVIVTLVANTINAQENYGLTVPTYIEPFSLDVTLNKTTNLLFHYKIKNVDRGSGDIIARTFNDTVLLVKAGRENFRQTNLSVYTADGKLHAFTVNYSPEPKHLDILVNLDGSLSLYPGIANKQILTDDLLEYYSKRSVTYGRMWGGHRDKNYRVSVRLTGIYVHSNVLFFPLELSNNSLIDYDISQLRFFIRDEKKAKRTATQELSITPLYVFGNSSTIPGNSMHTAVFALPKFTIADKKYLSIDVQEKEGGRNLQLEIHNRSLVKAILIN